MKKIVSVLLSVVLIIVFLPTSTMAASVCTINVSSVSASRNDIIEVNVNISANSMAQACGFALHYDKNVLQVVDVEKGNAVSAKPIINTNQLGKITYSYAATTPITSAGAVVKVFFQVKANAAYGTSDLLLEVTELSDGNFQSVPYSAVSGKVNVVAPVLPYPSYIETVELEDTYAAIRWEGIDSATGYNVYLNGELFNEQPLDDNYCTFYELTQNEEYRIEITTLHYSTESDKSPAYIMKTDKTMYSVVFVDWNYATENETETSILEIVYVEHGEDAVCSILPNREGYQFTGWDQPCNNITDNIVIRAQYDPIVFEVSFVDWDGTVLLQQTVPYGGAAEAPATPSRDGYVFTTWNKAFSNVKEDLTVQAQYEQITCEHLNTKVQGRVESTCQTPGFAGNVVCTDCGDTISVGGELELADHSYQAVVTPPTSTTQGFTTHTCSVCGDCYIDSYVDPAVRPTLTLKSPTLEFKDMITVNAFYTAENIQNVVEMGMITYSIKVPAADITTAEHVIPGATYVESSGRYYSCSQGIHAKYLGDMVYLAIYAKLSDGSYAYSKVAGYSAVQYANSQLKNSTDAKLKQLVVAMLNYGAEAQLYFSHNTVSLANASLTADQKMLPESYRADMVQTVPVASSEKQGIFTNNSGFSKRMPAISFEGAFCINYFFTPKYVPSSGIMLYYWNEADYHAASVLTTSNATGKIKLEGSGTGEYRGDIIGIAAKDLSGAVYVAAAYKDSSGTVWTSGVLGYSIGTYCSSQASKGGTISELAKATAVYGYHAKTYFG